MRPNRMSGTGLPSSNIRSDGSSGAARVKTTPAVIAAQIRRALKEGGSAEHAQSVQRSFQEEIKSPGWYTADLRRAAARFPRQIQKDHGLDFLVAVADQLFFGSMLEEKIAAIFLLEKLGAPSLVAVNTSRLSLGWAASAVGRIMMRWSITALRRWWLENRHG
jgi:hypothetical protein